MKTIFIPCKSNKEILPALKKTTKKLSQYEKIALITTAQHLHELDNAKKYLEEKGKEVFVAGQILGCNTKKAEKIIDEVDALLYIGTGRFHPTAFLSTDKPVIIVNPYSLEVTEITREDRNRFRRKQKARMLKAIEAQKFGILVSTKTGQLNLKKALEIKKKIEDCGRKAVMFSGDEITPSRLTGYKIDAWINTACPRIIEDEFDKPILNPDELEEILEALRK